MRLGEAFRVALDALRANRLRSGLTMLGVIIGVAAVVVLVAIGTGAKNEVEAQVRGPRLEPAAGRTGEVQARVRRRPVSRLDLTDVDAVARVVGDRDRVAATVTSGEDGTRRQPAELRQRTGGHRHHRRTCSPERWPAAGT